MQKRSVFLPIFLIFIIFSFFIIFLSQTGIVRGVGGFFEGITLPLQRFTFAIFNPSNKSVEDKLREENLTLTTELAKQKEIENENKALHDQFAVSNPEPKQLLPAKIIGIFNNQIIIDKGQKDGVKSGQAVVFKDNLIGQVSDISVHRSTIKLLSSAKTSFTAQTVKTTAAGVVNGASGDEIILDKVVLSDKLNKDDIVVTTGDIDQNGRGYLPGLVVGKIVSINKKASSLFQTAEVQSLVDFSKLETVFVLLQQ